MKSVSRPTQPACTVTSGLSRRMNLPSACWKPALFAFPKPTLTASRMTLAWRKVAATASAEPSVEALSTTTTSTGMSELA